MKELQPRYSIKIGNTQHVNKTEAELLAVKGIGQVTINELKAKAKLDEVNQQAFVRIDAAYPQWKQANITRSGSAAEQTTMNNFIDAVRAWANSVEPVHADLLAIVA